MIQQLSPPQADKVGQAAYYATRDCSDGKGSVIAWERLPQLQQDYYIGIANCVLTEDAIQRGLEIIPRLSNCGCACNSGGFCGGCGHAGCGGRTGSDR